VTKSLRSMHSPESLLENEAFASIVFDNDEHVVSRVLANETADVMWRLALHSCDRLPSSRASRALPRQRAYREAQVSTQASRMVSPMTTTPWPLPRAVTRSSSSFAGSIHKALGNIVGKDVTAMLSKRVRTLPATHRSVRAYATSSSDTSRLMTEEANYSSWTARARHYCSPPLYANSKQFTHHDTVDFAASSSPPTPSSCSPSPGATSPAPTRRLGALLAHYLIVLPWRGFLWVATATVLLTLAWSCLTVCLCFVFMLWYLVYAYLSEKIPQQAPSPAPVTPARTVDLTTSPHPALRAATTIAAIARSVGL